jgi:hypothetical protein
VFTALGKRRVRSEIEFAFQLAGMMTAGAAPLQNRHEITVIAHGLFSGVRRQRRGTEQGKDASQRVH